jgi:hypothetical protein
VAAAETLAERRILVGKAAEALDAAAGLEPRDCRRQVPAGDPVGGRKRLARFVERGLLGDGRPAEGAADGYPPERAGGRPSWRSTIARSSSTVEIVVLLCTQARCP